MADILTAQQVKAKLEAQEKPVILDVLPPVSFILHHLPGAVNVPIEYLHSVMQFLPHDRDIVVYCSHDECPTSLVAAHMLEDHKFTRVFDFHGGLKAWAEADYLLYSAVPLGHLAPNRPVDAVPAIGGDEAKGGRAAAGKASGGAKRRTGTKAQAKAAGG